MTAYKITLTPFSSGEDDLRDLVFYFTHQPSAEAVIDKIVTIKGPHDTWCSNSEEKEFLNTCINGVSEYGIPYLGSACRRCIQWHSDSEPSAKSRGCTDVEEITICES